MGRPKAADDKPNDGIVSGSEKVSSFFLPYVRKSPPWDAYEYVKTALCCVFLLPIRVISFVVIGLLMFMVAGIAMAGLKDKSQYLFSPFPGWRKSVLKLLPPLARAFLFSVFGVYYIEARKADFSECVGVDHNIGTEHAGQDASKSDTVGKSQDQNAYVVVSNHLGYIDIITLFAKYRCSFVAKGGIAKVPVVGTIAVAMQSMFVREGASLTDQLVERVETTYKCHRESVDCPGCGSCMNKIIIFPEGTTTNGEAMVPFRTGVFLPGLPVKPVCIEFPHQHFNMSWETIRFRHHLFRTMTQFRNRVRLVELPVYLPSEAERANPRLYASNVQAQIAHVLKQPVVPLNRKHKFLYHNYLLGRVKTEEELFEGAEDLTMKDSLLAHYSGLGPEGFADRCGEQSV